ncbi:MAG TPA: STAS domain-containing protein [Gammaproteobacteria bacterium]|nr:STAS domain-containing protein [Gammaproteobacteria bacterium]
MFEIDTDAQGIVRIAGRLSSASCEQARRFLEATGVPRVIDCTDLRFLSSAGLGVLLVVQKRLTDSGDTLTLRHVSAEIREVLRHTGLDGIFDVEGG